ncbi:hypothetical protein [Nonlabens agnitus]|uniref:Curlin n=1 Tax=Nonlabens agnitus TaxID=870484 RepID=A0A2S9WRU3_9FLAO|nr:hypothetical protein [Nonlabens agnitus]PRP66175.1 hypothetical protein BST86_03250 [Nonlabens agnitus]
MKHVINIFAFLLIATVSSAQTYVNDAPIINANSLSNQNEQLNVAQKQSFSNQQPSTTAPTGNTVFIQQVGFGNVGLIDVTSNNSEVTLLQSGYKNKALVLLRADNIQENIQQIGNRNLFLDYSLHGAETHNVDVQQNGSYNSIISVGKNSISERLQLQQTGIGKAAFIIHN